MSRTDFNVNFKKNRYIHKNYLVERIGDISK